MENTKGINNIDNGNNSGVTDITKIITKEKWRSINNIATLTYSFNRSIPEEYHYYKSDDHSKVFSLNNSQARQAKRAMQSISDVANIEFIEAQAEDVANVPIINVFLNQPIGGYAYYPNASNFSPICINSRLDINLTPSASNFGGHILTHELLHTLGLKHTHNPVGLTKQESTMSYLSEHSSGADFDGHYATSPQLYDIAALQHHYGANLNTRTGDTTYGFNSNTYRAYLTATRFNDTLIFCAWDAGGTDTFDFSGYAQDQIINLNAGHFSHVGGLKGNVSIAFGVTIENAIGGSGDDKIIGNNADNILVGGLGADQIWGDNGSNIFRYHKTTDSETTSTDTLHDFNSDKDKLDLSPIIYGKNDIYLVDRFSFSGQTEIIEKYDKIKDITYFMIDFDNNIYETDMMIKIAGKQQLTLNNFITSPQQIA